MLLTDEMSFSLTDDMDNYLISIVKWFFGVENM